MDRGPVVTVKEQYVRLGEKWYRETSLDPGKWREVDVDMVKRAAMMPGAVLKRMR